jgi:hypothetical protein
MGTVSLDFRRTGVVRWWRKLAAPSMSEDCVHSRSLWHRVSLRCPGILLNGRRYCIEHCFEKALAHAFHGVRNVQPRQSVSHRIPLGLLLLSRQQLTVEQLQSALEWQRREGRGRIGEWLQRLGFVTELQVTAALARQWSCPILHNPAAWPAASGLPRLPMALLTNFLMVPVHYVEPTRALHMAFAEEVDYSVLYAVEQMTGCHTVPCLALPSFVRGQLQTLCAANDEIILENAMHIDEICEMSIAYCARLSPTEVRVARCSPYFWIRLLRESRPPFDLVFGTSSLHMFANVGRSSA